MDPELITLQNTVDSLQSTVDSLIGRLNDKDQEIEELQRIMIDHGHQGDDGSARIDKNIHLLPQKFLTAGKAQFTDVTTGEGSSVEVNKLIMAVGPEPPTFLPTSLNTELNLEHQPNGINSFYYGFRPPLYTNTGSVTSAGTTLTDAKWNWDTNELAGAYINIANSAGTHQFTRQIASNTSTVITIDGTWPSTVTGGVYVVFMPIFFGSAQFPWRQLYSLGDDVSSGGTGAQRRALRMGFGTTAGADVISLYFGTGSPESVITANIGSIYLRTDGGASTTFYVKESGTGNTGWIPK